MGGTIKCDSKDQCIKFIIKNEARDSQITYINLDLQPGWKRKAMDVMKKHHQL